MTVKQLKAALNMLDDNAIVKLEVTDSDYNQHTAELTTYEAEDDYVTLQAEEDE